MRILFLTNFYPPLHRGGYEEWCAEVAAELQAQGHEVRVLTSRHRREEMNGHEPAWIQRELYLEMPFASLRNGLDFFVSRRRREEANLERLQRMVEEAAPDVIMVWGMWNLPRSLAGLAESLRPRQVLYYLGDYWPTLPSQHLFYWQAPAQSWLSAVPKRLLRKPAEWMVRREGQTSLRFPHALFCSAYLRDELQRRGISFEETKVVYGGVDVEPYLASDSSGRGVRPARKLLFVGRLREDKGVQTAIEAMVHLGRGESADIILQIVGSGEPEFEARLQDMVKDQGLSERVFFLGTRPKTELPELYEAADIFLFPSIWPEPFGRVLVEAMASGLPIVGTRCGGAGELLTEEENALIFPAGDAQALAAQVTRLQESATLRQRLADNGKHTALTRFDVKEMTSGIARYLEQVIE